MIRKISLCVIGVLCLSINAQAQSPSVVFPPADTQFNTDKMEFRFDTDGLSPDYFDLSVGYSPGSSSIYSSGQISLANARQSFSDPDVYTITVEDLPLDESILYFNLNINSNYPASRPRIVTRYRAARQVPYIKDLALVGDPGPAVFSWTHNGLDVIDYVFVLKPGFMSSNSYRGRPRGRVTSSLPIYLSSDGWNFTARLWYKLASDPRRWRFVDRLFAAFD